MGKFTKVSDIETDLTRKIKDWENKKSSDNDWVCPECSETKTQFSLQIIPTHREGFFPRWVPQVKESCASCGRYRRFAPQSDILIKRFNDRLQSIILPATGRDFYEEDQK